ncbi:PLP-dependent aminotransferase family protein [Cellulomonas cellasea]|uniref:DNA-binding transcriptional MocR family regulator n=1 Tax=Cellulomonas cellasea TaxID=43670 RepID=A0A7W4UC97_9CELL|nr:PLP-dependent aminotransferase family protein [Cellulomonas cellasea]MBB2921531.1 DNA-binding transcriptional MocR family regulator [Cellulomonas cellasea]
MSAADDLPSDRRLSANGLARLLGSWQRPGPAYAALADGVRSAMHAGSLPLSTRLPSERELAEALGVSRTTTTAAYRTLRDEGFLVSRQGSGTVTTLPASGAQGVHAPVVVRPSQPDVADLSIAAPPAPSALHPAYVTALDALPRYLAGRGYEPLGLQVLREAIAARYTERGTPTTPDQVLVTSGAQHALNLLVHAHVGPGDRVVVEHPTYPHAIDTVRAAGGRPVPVPLSSGPSGGVDVDLLESTLRQVSPRLVYLIPDHHNPTGTTLDPAARERVRALARRHRTVVVGDEALTDLTLDGPEPAPFAGAGAGSGFVVSVGSASKTYWGGLRVGWIRAHPDLVSRLAVLRGHVDIASAVLEQLVTAELLARREEILPGRRTALRERRDRLVELLADQIPSWQVPVPAGGLSLWPDLGAPVASALTALAVRHGVRVLPGPAFAVDGGFERHLRLTFSEPLDVLENGVRGLAAAWAALGMPQDARRSAPVQAMV